MDPEHSASQPSSLSYGRNTVDSTKILINHKDKDSLCHTNISSSDVTVEEYSTSTSESCEDSASGRRASTGQAHNIPYMQHFHHLKQKFPDLKDCDINESIQKFGLDLARCEAELQQRAQSYLSGYYGPWGRGNLSSRSSPITTPSRNASLTSPNTPTLSPYPSPFSSQVLPSSRTMASSRSTPKLFSPKTTRNSPGPRESNTIPLCSPSSCVPSSQVTSSSMAFSSSLMPSLATTAGPAVYTPATIYAVTSNIKNNNTHGNQNVITSPSIHNGSSLARVPSSQADPYHTTTTRHYVGTSVHHNINEPFYRQYSNSSETITEESSLMGSNIPSPAPTLTFSSPQSPLVSPPSHNHCTDMPDLSRLLEQLPISQNASNHNQFHQPTNPYLPTWNQGNERAPNVSVLPNAQLLSYVDNDILYNRTREQAAQSGISTSSVNRENNSDAMYFSSPPEHNNPGGDKLALDPSEIRRRRPNLQSRLEPVRIAPPPPVSTSANIAPARQMSRLADLQLCTVSPPSFVPPPLPPSSSTAAGLNQPSAKIDNRKGLLDDQRARQQRMLAVLTDGTKDRTSLQEEVSKLSHSLEEIRQKGIAEANRYAKLIHDIQEENRLLQSECDRFEGEILQTGEEPDLVETGYGAHFSNHREGPGFSLSSPSSPLPARPQPFNRGVSVGRGVTEGSQRFTPTRVAPPPPVSSAATPSAAPQFPSSGFESLPHQHAMGGNAASAPRWSCNRCTYDNHPDMTSCEICGAIRMPPSPHTPAGGFPRPSLVSELSSQADPL